MSERSMMNNKQTLIRRIHFGFAIVIVGLAALFLGAARQQEQEAKPANVEVRSLIRVSDGKLLLPGGHDHESGHWSVQYDLQGESIIIHRDETGGMIVTINGQSVPPDRLLQTEGQLRILDEEGNEIQMLGMFQNLNSEFMNQITRQLTVTANLVELDFSEENELSWLGRIPTFNVDFQQPLVMLGIFTSETSPALEKHLQLEAQATITITGLHEDLPAHQAGLELHDIILSVDGRQPVTRYAILETLQDKQPGDTLDLSFIQAGQRKLVSITLEAFDSERMAKATLIGEYPNRFRPRVGNIIRMPSARPLPTMPGVLFAPGGKDFFRFAPEGMDLRFHQEIRGVIGELKKLERKRSSSHRLKVSPDPESTDDEKSRVQKKREGKTESHRP